MTDYIESKQVVRDFYQALGRAHNETQSHKLAEIISAHVAPDYLWRGMHPFYELQGATEVAEVFWQPLNASFTNLQRRVDLFMAGSNTIDGGASEWVCSMGQLMGLLDQPWLGIPATRKMSFIRYAEFHRVEDGKIHDFESNLIRRLSGLLYISDFQCGNAKKKALLNLQNNE